MDEGEQAFKADDGVIIRGCIDMICQRQDFTRDRRIGKLFKGLIIFTTALKQACRFGQTFC